MAKFFRTLWLSPASFFTLFALLVAAVFWRDAGRCWDDGVHAAYGQAVWRYFGSGGAEWSPPEVEGGPLKYYGPLCGLLDAAWHAAWGLETHAQRPWVISWFWILCFAPVVWLARGIGGVKAGWLAGGVLLTLPRFFGEAFVNEKDLPLACAFAWCVWTAWRLGTAPGFRWRDYAWAGLAITAALAARPAAVFAFGPLLMVGLWRVVARRARPLDWRGVGREAGGVAMASVIAFGAVSLMWPTVWEDGWKVWPETLRLARSFAVAYPVLYQGTVHQSDALPWHYPFVYLFITTPPTVLALSVVGVAVMAKMAADSRRGAEWLATVLTLTFLAFPFALFVATRPNIYDGIRHFLFVAPLFAVAAGAGGGAVLARAADLRAVAAAVVALAALWGAGAIVRYYPYSLAYFNFLAGPRETLHARYETDYWVLSYREAAEWINERQREADRPLNVLISANDLALPAFTTFIDPKVRVSGGRAVTNEAALPRAYDYYVSTVRYGLAQRYPASPVRRRIERDGVLFTVIRGSARED